MQLNTLMFQPPKNTYTEKNKNLYWIPYFKEKTDQDFVPVYWYENLPTCDQIIIYFHARQEDIETSYTFVMSIADLLKTHAILVEYPTYGVYKDVQISEQKIYNDSICIYDFLVKKMKFLPQNIILLGRSLGVSPAIYLASKKKCMFVALLTPFTSFKDIARDKITIFLSIFLRNSFNNIKLIQYIDEPIFILHGKKDKVVSFKQAQKLYENCKNKQSVFKLVDTMTHNDFNMEIDLLVPLLQFKKKIEKKYKEKQKIQSKKNIPKNDDDVEQEHITLIKAIEQFKEKSFRNQLNLQIFQIIITMFNAALLNDSSICDCLCKQTSLNQDMNKLRQLRSRIGYTVGLILLGIFTFFVKNYAETMFWFIYPEKKCYKNTQLHTCFTLVMIYRISFVIVFYHLILMILSAVRNAKLYQFTDFCWTLKIILFLELFFISCIIPNEFFQFWVVFFKYIVIIFLVLKTILIQDAIFYYFNKGRYAKKNGQWTTLWIVFAYCIGVICFGLGLTLFIYCFIKYDRLCGQYIAINTTLISLSSVQLIICFIRYRFKVEFAAALVNFSVISIFNFGIVAATPYSKCLNTLNMSFLQTQSSTNIDSAFNFIFLAIGLLFISAESWEEIDTTLSQRGRGLYKGLTLDLENFDQVVTKSNGLGVGLMQGTKEKQFVKRNKKNVPFHGILILVGIYFSMNFTSWTSIYEYEQSYTDDYLKDNYTIWLRFGATCLGITYTLIMNGLNLISKDKFQLIFQKEFIFQKLVKKFSKL